MELWLDTTDIDVIYDATQLGKLTGVTTNPSILSKADALPDTVLTQILAAQPGYVAAQVIAQDLTGILDQAYRLRQLSDRIMVKIPVIAAGLKAIAILARENIPTIATAIFEPNQVVLAEYAGAKYAAFYLSKAEEAEGNAFEVLQEMIEIIARQKYSLKLLAASISLTSQVVACAKMGVHAITLPKGVYESLLEIHKLTDKSVAKFQEEWSSGIYTSKSKIF